MEDIFVVKRFNKATAQGRREGEVSHQQPITAVWYRIADTRTGGFIGDGYEHMEDAMKECRRLNAASSRSSRKV